VINVSIFQKHTWPHLPIFEIRKRARLLVIDDQDFYYLPLFINDGYNIEKWDDIKDLGKLESGYFDIILLDIQGVGKEFSKDEGFGILKHLRKCCPTQIIVAYSNADFSVKYQDFFQMADAVLHKQKDYVDFKLTVDQLLQDRFSMGFYMTRIDNLVGSTLSEKELTRLHLLSRNSMYTNSTEKLNSYLEKTLEHKEITGLILQIVGTAFQIYSNMR
jgi:hypothetical protein